MENTHIPKEMMQDPEFRAIMERIEKSNDGQERYAKKQYHMSQISAVASVAVLAIVIYVSATLLPVATKTFQDINAITKDLQVITAELSESDLQGMISDVDSLVSTSEKGIQDAVGTLNSIDIDTLNKAIKDLSDVVEPLANFFNRF